MPDKSVDQSDTRIELEVSVWVLFGTMVPQRYSLTAFMAKVQVSYSVLLAHTALSPDGMIGLIPPSSRLTARFTLPL